MQGRKRRARVENRGVKGLKSLGYLATPLNSRPQIPVWRGRGEDLRRVASQKPQGPVTDSPGLFHALFQHMAEGVALHELIYDETDNPKDYRILDINPAYTLLTGLTREAACGKCSREVYGTDSPPYLNFYVVTGNEGRPHRFETYFAPMDRHFSISVAPMGRGFFATIFTDITENKRLQREREQSEKKFEQVFDLAPTPISVFSLDGALISVNRAACEYSGWSKDELIGKRSTELDLWADAAQRDQFLARLRREKRVSGVEVALRTRSGEIRTMDFSAAIVDLDGTAVLITAATDITDVRAAERAREVASRTLEHYFNLSLDLMCIADLDGRFLRLNPAWEDVLGYPLDTLLGGRFLDYVHPDDVTSTEQSIGVLAAGEPVINFTNRYRRCDGTYRYIEWRTMPSEKRLIYAAARDVTDRVEAAQALRRSVDDLERSQAVARLGSYRLYADNATWECSRALDEIFGIGSNFPKTVQGWMNLVHPDDRDAMTRHLSDDVLTAGNDFDREYRIVRQNDGAVRWVHGLGNLEYDSEGRVCVMFGTIQDVTERHEAEQARLRLEEKLLQSQKLESLGVLAGGIAHDFNNLLTGILGNASLCLDELPQSAPTYSQLLDIESASKRAADLCRQLLAYSGKGRFLVQPLSLNALVREMVHLLAVTISKKVTLKYEFSDAVSPISADATQIRQVVMNLITNAAESYGEGSGLVSVRTGCQYCDATYLKGAQIGHDLPEALYCLIEVADHGSGMAPETLARIFDPFFTTKFTGRGLGLAAVLGIVRGHRGAMKVRTRIDQGTTFTVLFPAISDAIEATQTHPEAVSLPGSGLVLLVDDEETVRDAAREILSRAGFQVLEAVDGEDALAKFLDHWREIRIVVLDLTMPRLDGDACLRQMQEVNPEVSVLITSGYDEQDIAKRFSEKCLKAFLQKPFTRQQLLGAMQAALKPQGTALSR